MIGSASRVGKVQDGGASSTGGGAQCVRRQGRATQTMRRERTSKSRPTHKGLGQPHNVVRLLCTLSLANGGRNGVGRGAGVSGRGFWQRLCSSYSLILSSQRKPSAPPTFAEKIVVEVGPRRPAQLLHPGLSPAVGQRALGSRCNRWRRVTRPPACRRWHKQLPRQLTWGPKLQGPASHFPPAATLWTPFQLTHRSFSCPLSHRRPQAAAGTRLVRRSATAG